MSFMVITPLSTIYFSYIVVVSFIGEGTRSIYFTIGFWSCFQCDMFFHSIIQQLDIPTIA